MRKIQVVLNLEKEIGWENSKEQGHCLVSSVRKTCYPQGSLSLRAKLCEHAAAL